MKKVLLTGFEPFGPYHCNPTQGLIEWNNKKRISTGNEHVIGIVLPCTYYGAFKVLSNLIDIEKPDAIISFGLSSILKAIRIETVFTNMMKGKYADKEGYNPNYRKISLNEDAPHVVVATMDANAVASILHSKNIPVELSNDADTFLCNSLGYLTTQKILSDNLPIRNIFMHVPWTDDYRSEVTLDPGKIFLKKEFLYDAVDYIVEYI
jgi:pyroglutamyl-peptidase